MKRISALLCALFLSLAFGLPGQIPAELLQLPLQMDPAILSGQLENGLSYHILANPKPENKAELRLSINVGSVNEDDDQRGLAHFTEHMAFNGTKSFAKSEMVNYLSSIGMGYSNGLNGMTGYDNTTYTFKLPTDDQVKLRKGLQILSEMAWQVSFDPAEIERERGVIIEEWRLGQSADQRVSDAQNAVFLAGSRYAERSPIGTFEVLSTFPHEALKRFYTDWYRPDLQTVVVVGDFDPQQILALIQEFFGPIPARTNPRPRQDFYVPDNLTPQAVVVTDPEYTANDLSVMWKKPVQTFQNLGDYLASLRRTLFYEMLNTRLDELSKQADPPYSYAYGYEYSILRTMSAAYVSANFTAGKAETALSTLLTETERVQRYGFLPTEFERAKLNYKRRVERDVAGKNTRDSDMLAWRLIFTVNNNNVFMSPDQALELVEAFLETITLDEVNSLVAQLIPEKNMCVSIGAPAKEGLAYPTQERLLEIVSNATAQQIGPYEDKVVNEPLMPAIPASRNLKKESFDAANGVQTWVLANGATVYAKQTDFKDDEVLLFATSPGGYSQYPAADIPAAKLLPDYVAESGFGNFDAISLDKAKVGKVARAGLDLSLTSEGFNGSCSPQDLEVMFQMIHQYGTNARFDDAEFASFIQRTKAYYDNYNLEPMNVFGDKLGSAIYGGNPYTISLAEADLDAVKLADLERIYRDRWGDFSDFSFVIVGNFDAARLRELCNTYLANLPTQGRKEKARDVGLNPVQGKSKIQLRQGQSERSFASLITNAKYSFNARNSVLLDALMHVVNEKLRENIRENLSGVYVVQAVPNTSNYPRPHIQVFTFMACSPARVDELNAATEATLDSLRRGLIDERYLASARATLQQVHSEMIRSNRYWGSQMASNLKQGLPLTQGIAETGFSAINRKSVAKAARKYLNYGRNQLTLVMLPETSRD